MGDQQEFFLQENVWLFCQAAKKSSRNNKVTVLLRLAIRQGCTVVKNLSGKNNACSEFL